MYKKGACIWEYLSVGMREDFTEKTGYDLRHKVDVYLVTMQEDGLVSCVNPAKSGIYK